MSETPEESTNETAEELAQRLAALVLDPDPQRKVLACLDCRTPQIVVTAISSDRQLLAIAHDSTCPALAAMDEHERYVPLESVTVVHRARPDGR